MAKLQDYEFKKLGQQVIDFKDDITDLLNNGKVAHPIVTSVPAWNADNGEMAFYDGAASGGLSGKRIYVRLSSSWEVFATAPFTGFPSLPSGAIQFESGGAFGGTINLIWDNTGRILTTSAQVVIMGSNQTNGQYLVVGGADLNSAYPFVVNTRGNISIGSGIVGNGARNVIALANGFLPGNIDDSVQIFGRAFGTNPVEFGIVPEFGGPHLFGVGLAGAAVFSTSVVTCRNLAGGVSLQLDGDVSNAAGTAVEFIHSSVRANLDWNADTVGTNFRAGPRIKLGPNNAGGQKAFVFLDASVQSGLIDEQPQLVVGQGSAFVGIQGAGYYWNSANIIQDQRNVIFFAPRLHGAVSGGGGGVTSVSNAATVYIEGPPRVITPGSLNVINSYALWIGTGDIRVGGNIITGGNTTVTRGGTFFSTTGIGVASNNATEITLIRGAVGTTSLVANTLSEGRTIRLSAWGYFNTPLVVDNLTMRVKLGGTTILTTDAQTPAASASSLGWKLDTMITCQTTGGAGTIIGQGDAEFHSSLVAKSFWQMVNSAPVVVNTTAGNVLEITAQWAGASSASQLFMTNCVGELMN